jgi:uncharacterized membrane protein YdjX (TVP38/TMEM64 family)
VKKEYVGVLALVTLVVSTVLLTVFGYLPSFEDIRDSRESIKTIVESYPLLAPVVYALVYALVVTLSLPVATALTLLAGFLFGVALGLAVVAVGATVGAAGIFLIIRYFFSDYTRKRFSSQSAKISFESFTDVLLARLVPVFPFVVVNMVAPLTAISFRKYVAGTFVGILPFTIIYILAGARLGEINSPKEVLAPRTFWMIVGASLIVLLLYGVKKYRTRSSVH